jgi:flavin-dependent dehydrogenase
MAWKKLKGGGWKEQPKQIVFTSLAIPTSSEVSPQHDYDVVVVGGTLGVFYALALQLQGLRTCIVEKGKIAGRQQEWNISEKELKILTKMGLMSEEEEKEVVNIKFNPVRVGFTTDLSTAEESSFETFVEDILNLGVAPEKLISLMKRKYTSAGGTIMEDTGLERIDVYENLALLTLSSSSISSKIVLDAMGNNSPIARQMRGAVKPDGICIVVGSCGRGFEVANNTYSDLIYCCDPIVQAREADSKLQYYWEAFPSGSGTSDRTTYLFTYMDVSEERPTVANILDDYWKLLPRYQGKRIDELEFLRVLYGCFPTYRASPLRPTFNRILQVGDASGVQSPLSFGGFGSMTRHLGRLVGGIKEAIDDNLTSSDDLCLLNPYQPNLASCWFFQRTMSVPIGGQPHPDLIVSTLSNSFSSMQKLGDSVMRPFLQDVIMFTPLVRTLVLAAAQDPLTPFKIIPHVGVAPFVDFLFHFSVLGIFTFLSIYVSPAIVSIAPFLPPKLRFAARRTCEMWRYGAGLDFYDH